MKAAELVERVGRGIYKITKRGKDAYTDGNVDLDYLKRFEEFRKWINSGVGRTAGGRDDHQGSGDTPIETIIEQSRILQNELADKILDSIMGCSPAFFEKLVVNLMIRMGYGYDETAGIVTGRTGDGGIDGVIYEDKLGFNRVYIQAKRWNRNESVGSPEIQKFVGALVGRGANKGLFITTASFTRAARDEISNMSSIKVVTIDGLELAKLMIEYNIGVSVEQKIEIKKIDSDYFYDDID